MAVDKLPQVLEEKWWLYVEDKEEDGPDLVMIEKWLSRKAFVHDGCSAFKRERREEDRRSTAETNGSRKHRTSVLVQM